MIELHGLHHSLHQPIIFLISYDISESPCDPSHPMLRYGRYMGVKINTTPF